MAEYSDRAKRQAEAWILGLTLQVQTGGKMPTPEEAGEAAGIVIAFAADWAKSNDAAVNRGSVAAHAVERCRAVCLVLLREVRKVEQEIAGKAEQVTSEVLSKLGVKSCPK